MKLFAYNQGSQSAKALAQALGIKRLKHEGKLLVLKGDDFVINWGASNIDRAMDANILNHPYDVAKACNKLTSFRLFKEAGVVTPEWTEEHEDACHWLREHSVVARTVLNGHSGEGIVICDKTKVLPVAPLYTKYVKKAEEYRLHVFQGEVFFVQRKARKHDVPDDQVNWKVRNLDGGFIYANKDVEVPEEYKSEAVKAIAALGLDFGAVDLITEKASGKAYVLEVNTACGLAGTTLDKYVEVFKRLG